jgi:predicted MFS family arabinose efflux permease
MQLTRFGRTGMSVSRLCLGTATFGKQTDEAESHRILDEAGKDHANIGSATLSANRQIGALCSVALMGLLLDTIPDWGLSLRVVFTVFALCMVAALVLVQRGMTAAKPAVPGGES